VVLGGETGVVKFNWREVPTLLGERATVVRTVVGAEGTSGGLIREGEVITG